MSLGGPLRAAAGASAPSSSISLVHDADPTKNALFNLSGLCACMTRT
jgi:hypothetical protein